MPEKVMPCSNEDQRGIRETVCIHTRKIFDQARDKDCLENLRFYPEKEYEGVINRAVSAKGGEACLLHVYVNVEPVNFNRGFYTVDMRFYYKVTLQVYLGCPAPVKVSGLCVFDKRAILCGSEGNAKIFTSEMNAASLDCTSLCSASKPIAVVEAVDPLVLDAKLVDACNTQDCGCDLCEIPACIENCFDSCLSCGEEGRRIYVTLGQFSIIRLERDTQLQIPIYGYCIPNHESTCEDKGNDDPCCAFGSVKFPVDSFFPPNCSYNDCCDDHDCHCCK